MAITSGNATFIRALMPSGQMLVSSSSHFSQGQCARMSSRALSSGAVAAQKSPSSNSRMRLHLLTCPLPLPLPLLSGLLQQLPGAASAAPSHPGVGLLLQEPAQGARRAAFRPGLPLRLALPTASKAAAVSAKAGCSMTARNTSA